MISNLFTGKPFFLSLQPEMSLLLQCYATSQSQFLLRTMCISWNLHILCHFKRYLAHNKSLMRYGGYVYMIWQSIAWVGIFSTVETVMRIQFFWKWSYPFSCNTEVVIQGSSFCDDGMRCTRLQSENSCFLQTRTVCMEQERQELSSHRDLRGKVLQSS